jgi:hypothetical protein
MQTARQGKAFSFFIRATKSLCLSIITSLFCFKKKIWKKVVGAERRFISPKAAKVKKKFTTNRRRRKKFVYVSAAARISQRACGLFL